MNLPGLPFKKNKSDVPVVAFYYGLRIMPSSLQAVVWQHVEDEAPEVTAWSSIWEWKTDDVDSLLTQADQALGECSVSLPESVEEPNRVLLGVPVSWVKQGSLLPDARNSLKHLTSSLNLKAMGFVVVSEAIINKLNGEGNGAFSGVLVGIDGSQLDVTLAMQGQVQQSLTYVVGEGSVTQEVVQAIKSIDYSPLPPKIYLFNADHDLSHTQHELLRFDWQAEDVGFMHIPAIEVLPSHAAMEAVIFSIMGQQPVTASQPVVGSEEVDELEDETDPDEEVTEESNLSDEPEGDEHASHLEELGFVKNADIREVKTPAYSWDEEERLSEQGGLGTPAAAGPMAAMQIDEPGNELDILEKKPTLDSKKKGKRPASPKLPKPPAKVMKWILLVLLTLLIVVGGLVGGWFWLSSRAEAVVTLKFAPQRLEKEFQVAIMSAEATQSAGLQADLEIQGIALTTRVEGEEQTATTGKKEVGERAKGTITIFNDTDAVRTLETGTRVTTSNDLSFTLDTAVEIASKSVDLSSESPFTPGRATVNVTAVDIGDEYNLAAETAFSVANFAQSVLLARNDGAFSGGSSREIQAVAEEDLALIEEQLETKLLNQGKAQLQQQLDVNQALIDTSITNEWVDQTFSHDAGEESETVSVVGEIKFEGLAYSEQQLKEMIASKLVEEATEGKELAGDIHTTFRLVDENEGVYMFSVVAKGYLAPSFTKDAIKEKIAGKAPSAVQGYLQSLPTVQEASYTISPNMPAVLVRYPKNYDRITITTEVISQ